MKMARGQARRSALCRARTPAGLPVASSSSGGRRPRLQVASWSPVEIGPAPRRHHHGWQRPLGEAARAAADQRPRERRRSGARMCRRMRRSEDRVPHALRLSRRKTGSARRAEVFALMNLLEKFPEGEDAGAAGEKCSAPGDRSPDGSAGGLPERSCTSRSKRPRVTTD